MATTSQVSSLTWKQNSEHNKPPCPPAAQILVEEYPRQREYTSDVKTLSLEKNKGDKKVGRICFGGGGCSFLFLFLCLRMVQEGPTEKVTLEKTLAEDEKVSLGAAWGRVSEAKQEV